MKYFSEDYEDFQDSVELNKRLCKTLYYGKMPTLDRPSLSMTELAVEVLQDIAPKELGKIDIDWAAAMSRELLMSPCSVMVGMMYAKRLKKKRSAYLQQISSSDLFLVSVMMASKFLYDDGEDGVLNDEWAASVNMDVKELNELERNFLAALEWELFVRDDEFWTALLQIERQLARRKMQERESMTYTELMLLSTDCSVCQRMNKLLIELCKVVSVCTAAYVASLLLLAASQLAVYTTVSSLMALSSSASFHSRFAAGIDTRLPADVENRPVFSASVGDDTWGHANLYSFSVQTSSSDVSVFDSLVHVLVSTLSFTFITRPTCRYHPAGGRCEGAGSCCDGDDASASPCHQSNTVHLGFSSLVTEDDLSYMPLRTGPYLTADLMPNKSSRDHQFSVTVLQNNVTELPVQEVF